MKYYVVADIHGFYTELLAALKDKGFFDDKVPHKLIVCGDIFDRGMEALKMQKFILELMEKDEVILVRGNHEDLFLEFLTGIHRYALEGYDVSHHWSNGTVSTCLQLTNTNIYDAEKYVNSFQYALTLTDYNTKIIPSTIDYFETEHYIFVHGWIPCTQLIDRGNSYNYIYDSNWREAGTQAWKKARWYNGMKVYSCGVLERGKTIVCGHFHTSWGHCKLEGRGSEFGEDADFSPFFHEGILALDGCTAYSKVLNCIVIED